MDMQAISESWKQHFPTYSFGDRDIALKEYESATKSLEAEERVFLNALNIVLAVGAAGSSFAIGSFFKVGLEAPVAQLNALGLVFIAIFNWFFARIFLGYFAERHLGVVFAARKVIVLRRMLGMTYGRVQLVLPNWRIEAADEPFAVKTFPGWNSYVVFPCSIISFVSAALTFWVFSAAAPILSSSLQAQSESLTYLTISASAAWFCALSWTYRKALFDTHETSFLMAVRAGSKMLQLRLVDNKNYIIYRATLASFEMQRLEMDLGFTKKLLMHIEDKEFLKHRGVSLKGLARLALSSLKLGRRSGGSTITQQLVRTLFIVDQSKLIRRKFIEILLAFWLNSRFRKNDQLDMYLAAVRYDHGVYGLPGAMNHFFGRIIQTPSKAQAFFLLERVSNIRSKILTDKINQTLRGVVAAGLLGRKDIDEVKAIYSQASALQKLIATKSDVEKLIDSSSL